MDAEGECIEAVSADGYDDDTLRLAGAYQGIVTRQLDEAHASSGVGNARTVHVRFGDVDLLAEALPGGYLVLLIMNRSSQAARARRGLSRVSAALALEL